MSTYPKRNNRKVQMSFKSDDKGSEEQLFIEQCDNETYVNLKASKGTINKIGFSIWKLITCILLGSSIGLIVMFYYHDKDNNNLLSYQFEENNRLKGLVDSLTKQNHFLSNKVSVLQKIEKNAVRQKIIEEKKLEKALNQIKVEKKVIEMKINSTINSDIVKPTPILYNKKKKHQNLPACQSQIGRSYTQKRNGWFNLLGGVVCGIARAIKHNETNFRVDVSHSAYGEQNSFNSVYNPVDNCEPDEHTYYFPYTDWHCDYIDSRSEMHYYFTKYIIPNAKTQAKIDSFVDLNFGNHTVGVHLSTDIDKDPAVARQHIHSIGNNRVIKALERYIEKNPETDRIFLVTDNVKQLENLKKRFGKMLVYRNAHRSKNSKKIHDGTYGQEKLSEVVVDARLLARTKYLFKTYSEVSLGALMINDKLDFDSLNYPDGFEYQNWRKKILNFHQNDYVKMEDV